MNKRKNNDMLIETIVNTSLIFHMPRSTICLITMLRIDSKRLLSVVGTYEQGVLLILYIGLLSNINRNYMKIL